MGVFAVSGVGADLDWRLAAKLTPDTTSLIYCLLYPIYIHSYIYIYLYKCLRKYLEPLNAAKTYWDHQDIYIFSMTLKKSFERD